MLVCVRVLDKGFRLNPDAQTSKTQVFAGRYVLLAEMVEGGQAIVNFARDQGSGSFQYAIKCDSAATVSFSQAAAPSRLPLLNTFAALGTCEHGCIIVTQPISAACAMHQCLQR